MVFGYYDPMMYYRQMPGVWNDWNDWNGWNNWNDWDDWNRGGWRRRRDRFWPPWWFWWRPWFRPWPGR